MLRRRPAGLIWISKSAMDAMRHEAAKRAPYESGGVLVGYWAEDEPVVTTATGPGPSAIHELYGFRPDYDFDEAVVAHMWEKTGGQETYLGDWHSHPGAAHGGLSRKDRRTLRRIGTTPSARATRPIMIVVYGEDVKWSGAAWEGRSCHVGRIFPCSAAERFISEF